MAVAQEPIPGEVIVMLEKNASLDEFDHQLHYSQATIQNISKSWNIWLYTFPQGQEESMLKQLQKIPQVRIAQFNHKVSRRALVPNDTLFQNQWGLNNTGQSGGTADADIDAPEAWERTYSGINPFGDTIVIAVVDKGFDLQHQDLRFWKNTNDPHNGIDDDLNGYIDDYNGWVVQTNTDSIPNDFHGTHIAGIAAAAGNDSVGVAGVAWNARLLPVCIAQYTEAQVVAAYNYIYDVRKSYNLSGGAEGAFVVAANSSFGIDFGKPEDYPLWCALYDSLGSVGVLSVVSTMNITADVEISGDIPSSCTSDYLIVVTNTTRYDSKNSTAAFGYTSVDLGAPGTSILSTVPGNGYANSTGTSMSAPHVAGAIAVLYGLSCPSLQNLIQSDPAGYALRMKRYILSGTDIIDALDGLTVSGGRLNLLNSVNMYFNDCISCLAIHPTETMVSCHDSADGTIVVTASDGISPYQFVWSTGDTANAISDLDRGKYWLTVTDSNGCEKSDYFEITQPFALVVNLISDSSTNGTDGSVAAFVSGGTAPYSYLWNDPLQTANAVVNDLPAGDYTVTVTDANGCQKVRSITVEGVSVVGIDPSLPDVFDFRLTPNPVSGIAWIEFVSPLKSPTHLSVFDISGKLILGKEITTSKTALDFTVFPQGNYFVKVVNNRNILLKKVVRL